VPSFANYKDMIGGRSEKAGYTMTPTTPISRTVCLEKAFTWYILPAYKIWRLSLQLFWRYDIAQRSWKWIMWPWPRPF